MIPPTKCRQAWDNLEDAMLPGGVITITHRPPVAEDQYTPDQRRSIDARVAKADEDIKAGRTYGPFNTAEEMASSIESNIKKLREKNTTIKSCLIPSNWTVSPR